MSGIDFGCDIGGTCPYKDSDVVVPLASMGGGDSLGYMKHFTEDDGVNMFRLRMYPWTLRTLCYAVCFS